jgi:DNA-binding transcriptional regulator YiaG
VLGLRGKPLRWTRHPDGYRTLHLRLPGGKFRTTTVHRVVCEAFHGPCPPGMEVAHKNDVPDDCRAGNLEWKTRSGNIRDRLRTGAYGHKLTLQKVREIRAQSAMPRVELAKRYGVAPSTISRIQLGRRWLV